MIWEANPYVDKIHVFREKLDEIIPDLRTEAFDFVVDLHKNIRSYRIKRALRLPSASFPKVNPEKWLMVNFKINLTLLGRVNLRYPFARTCLPVDTGPI